MYTRPKLKHICSVVEALTDNCAVYLKLTDSGGFEILRRSEEGAFELVGKNLRDAARCALDNAEKYLHDRRRERPIIREED